MTADHKMGVVQHSVEPAPGGEQGLETGVVGGHNQMCNVSSRQEKWASHQKYSREIAIIKYTFKIRTCENWTTK